MIHDALANRRAMIEEAKRILEAAQRGLDALEKKDTDAFNATVDEREAYLKRMEALQGAYEAPGEESFELKALHGELAGTLRAVRAADETAAKMAEHLLASYRAELKSMRQTGRQVASYTNMYREQGSIYIDEKR